jgi:hypothetical protein
VIKTDTPIEFRKDVPFLQVQPVRKEVCSDKFLQNFEVKDLTQLSAENWDAFRQTTSRRTSPRNASAGNMPSPCASARLHIQQVDRIWMSSSGARDAARQLFLLRSGQQFHQMDDAAAQGGVADIQKSPQQFQPLSGRAAAFAAVPAHPANPAFFAPSSAVDLRAEHQVLCGGVHAFGYAIRYFSPEQLVLLYDVE